jgi:glutaredoxin
MRSWIFLALLGAASAASAQLYRWTDERGRVHVTDTPPPAAAKNVRQRAAGAAPAAEGSANLPYAVQLAAKNSPVTLFTAPDCAPCGQARALLNARGVPFREVSVTDEQQADELRKSVGSLSVPSLRVGSTVQKGFEQAAYDDMLDSAGYPRAGVLPPRRQAEPKPAPVAVRKPAAEPADEPAEGEQAAAENEEDLGRSSGPYVPR